MKQINLKSLKTKLTDGPLTNNSPVLLIPKTSPLSGFTIFKRLVYNKKV